MQELRNEHVTVRIHEKGAELVSVQKDGTEYLWTGEKTYWEEHSPVLFPIVGRLYERKYRLQGQEYVIGLHGFAREKIFTLLEKSETQALFELQEDADSLKEYPFHFRLRIRYRLEGSCVKVSYQVENRSEAPMYFGLGGHPGFCIPLEEGLEFSEYHLEFCRPCRPKRVQFSETCLVTGQAEEFLLKDGRRLPLRHDLFDEDAIVLSDTPGEVFLGTEKGTKGIRFFYEDFPYLGIWHTTKAEAPFLCLEPWLTLPGRDGVVEDIAGKEDMVCLKERETLQKSWRMELV